MTADPKASPVTGTSTVVCPAGIIKVADETVAALVLLEVTLTVKPAAGAGPESVKVRCWVSFTFKVKLGGAKLIVAVTGTA